MKIFRLHKSRENDKILFLNKLNLFQLFMSIRNPTINIFYMYIILRQGILNEIVFKLFNQF